LEGCGGVAETKEHDKRFIESQWGFEGGFPFIAFLDSDVVVSPLHVKFGKIACTLEFID
jgi:hypothetical protein